MDVLAAIDLGSTSLKAELYDTEGSLLATDSRPTEKQFPDPLHPEWVVWDPEQIWQGAAAAMRGATAQLPSSAQVRAVAVTGMGMDGLPVDDRGSRLYPMISWHDNRTLPQMQWWQQQVGHDRQYAIGGNPLWPINSALRMLWIREHEPEIFRRTAKWLLIEDFLNYMLCGQQVTDYSMASCTLLLDQSTRDWSDELLAIADIPRSMLCDLRPSGTVIGEVQTAAAAATGLPPSTPVVLGGHDHLCGTLPVGVFEPGRVLDVTGTWETVIAAIRPSPCDPAWRAAGLTVQAHVAPDRQALWGGNVAAEMLEWFRRAVAKGDVADTETAWPELIRLAEAAPVGSGGVMFLPHMEGSASPYVDPGSRGSWVGLRTTADRGTLLRAVWEGLSFQLRDVLDSMTNAMDTPSQQIIVTGGGTRNRFWMQTKADVLDHPVEVAAVPEATGLGAAMLAGIGVGCYHDLTDAYHRVRRPTTVLEPDPVRARRYQSLFAIYRQLYPALRPLHQALNNLPADQEPSS